MAQRERRCHCTARPSTEGTPDYVLLYSPAQFFRGWQHNRSWRGKMTQAQDRAELPPFDLQGGGSPQSICHQPVQSLDPHVDLILGSGCRKKRRNERKGHRSLSPTSEAVPSALNPFLLHSDISLPCRCSAMLLSLLTPRMHVAVWSSCPTVLHAIPESCATSVPKEHCPGLVTGAATPSE